MGESKRKKSLPIVRERYDAEKQYPWLAPVLDAYAMSDEATVKESRQAEIQLAKNVACHAGCSACCKNPAVPILPPEVHAISWYVGEVLDDGTQNRLVPRLLNHSASAECPFLLDDHCSIYAVRPLICREHYVLDKPCEPGEQVLQTRPADVRPGPVDREARRRISIRMMDASSDASPSKKARMFEQGAMVSGARLMHELDWSRLADVIKVFQSRRSAK